ncbi:MAG: squalene/phytoene synthase family protein [Paracoccaceae bacterium]|jgi:phytoene/squalene synthetase
MSIEACAEIVRAGDPDRYLSAMTAPDVARDRLLVLYAFNLEIARVPWITNEEMIAEMRLQWWLDTIERIYEGKGSEHEVASQLAKVIEVGNLPQTLFEEMVNARRFDIYREGHSGLSEFNAYINATSGNLMRLAAMSLDADDVACVTDFGFAAGVANLWRALPQLYAKGRHPVPVGGALDRNAVAGGEVPDNLAEALLEITVNARQKLASSRRSRGQIPKAAAPAVLAGWQAGVPLAMVQGQPYETLRQPLESSEFKRRFSLLWRNSTGWW